MNFLVVDDERYMLKNIQTQLQRCKFSVTQIFTAVSAAQAREIISNSHVDIILCDIEMPQESGLELLLWVNKHHPRITNIVLTCYADFSYIQQALRLNVADYLVKPIPQEELQAAIQKAIDRINQSRQMEKHSSYGKYWAENESKLYENFWREVLQGTVPAEPEALQREATSRNLFLQMETRYIPILVCIYNRLGNTPQENAKNQGAVKELVRNTFVEVSQQGIVIETEWERLMCILPVASRQNIESSFFLDCCERMAGSAQTYFSCNLYCYIGESCAVADLNAVYLRFNEYSRHDVVKKHAVLLGSSIPKDTTGPLDLNILAMLLLEGEYVEARLEAETLLRREGATEEYLHFFYHNFVQILGNVLKKQDIS